MAFTKCPQGTVTGACALALPVPTRRRGGPGRLRGAGCAQQRALGDPPAGDPAWPGRGPPLHSGAPALRPAPELPPCVMLLVEGGACAQTKPQLWTLPVNCQKKTRQIFKKRKFCVPVIGSEDRKSVAFPGRFRVRRLAKPKLGKHAV